jgi:hypothetical protein
VAQSNNNELSVNMSSYGTISYSTTPIPTPTASALANVIVCYPSDDPTNVVTKAVAGSIYIIILQCGNWITDSSGYVTGINTWYSNLASWISKAKSVNPNIKIFAWVLAMSDYNNPPIAPNVNNAASRANCVSLAKSYVTDYGFDGFNDDTETYSGTTSNLAVLWNSMGAAMHSIGKLFSCDSEIWTGYDYSNLYPNLQASNIDLVNPMIYADFWGVDIPTATSAIRNFMNYVLTNCACNVAIGLLVREDNGATPIPFANQLSAIDAQMASHGTYSNFVGCCLWRYGVMTSGDWTTWNNWATKNVIPVT